MGSNDDKNYDALISDELEQVQQNADVINIVNAIEQAFDGFLPGGGTRFLGRTSFEGHRLNDMIDMVEPTKPEQVEEVGTSLLKAGEAITAAAQLLGGDIDAVDWEGDSGDAFRTWSKNLVSKAEALATYSKAVGEQITLAGSGLASVRKSMPPRDTRDDPKSVSDIPPAKRVESNEEYAAALKAEQDRQEAINQMIRLSSFYAVSEESLAAQEPPTFEPMPNVDVPPPTNAGGYRDDPTGGGYAGPGNSPTIAPRTTQTEVDAVAGRVDGTAVGTAPAVLPGSNGSMQIDSVATAPPPQETTRPVTAAPSPTTGPAATGTPVPPVMTNIGGRPAGGTTGGVNARQIPVTAQGQVPRGTTSGTSPVGQAGGRGPMGPMGPTGQQVSATGRTGATGAAGARSPMGPMGPTGQPTTTGRAAGAGARGVTGPMGPTGQPTASGRTGTGARGSVGPMGSMGQGQAASGRQAGGRGAGPVIGGMPASRGTSAGGNASGRQGIRPVQSGATAAGGVVGGRPAATTPNGPNGTRVPRGTVIGGDAGVVRGAGEQPGRRGVVGVTGASALGATGADRPTGQQGQSPKAPPGGVVGAPRPTGSRRSRDKKRYNDGERRETPPTNG
ncbi:hypothetical protein [Streptomyces sp. NPDC002640]